METCDQNRIMYAAAYSLLKRFAQRERIAEETFDKLNIAMAACQACDPILSHHCEKSEIS